MKRWALALMSVATMVALVAGAWAATGLLGGRGDGSAEVLANPPTSGNKSAAPDAKLAAAINDFGFDLMRTASTAATNSPRVVISPLSVHAALAMVETGARGNTGTQMRHVMHMDAIDPAAGRQAYADLLLGLASRENGELAIANSVWTGKFVKIKRSFIETDRKYFGAEIRSVDLRSRSAVDQINAWASENTHGRIPRILDDPLPRDTAAVLLNATYFLGKWAAPFTPSSTEQRIFHMADGTTIKAPLMAVHDSFEHTKTAEYEAVRLPYKDSGASMLVILPSTSSSLPRLLGSLDASGFAAIAAGLDRSDGTLRLPKLETDWSAQLAEPLKKMGMPDAFSDERADLSGMTDVKPGARIDKVVHKTYLRVDEQGTEAAAVTGVSTVPTAMPVQRSFGMVVDRPYLMAIIDDQSNTILFLAAINDPTK